MTQVSLSLKFLKERGIRTIAPEENRFRVWLGLGLVLGFGGNFPRGNLS